MKTKVGVNTKTILEKPMKFKENLQVNYTAKTEKLKTEMLTNEKSLHDNKKVPKRACNQLKTPSPKKQKLNNYRNLVTKDETQSSSNKNIYKTLQCSFTSEHLSKCYRSLQYQSKLKKANSQLNPKVEDNKSIVAHFIDNRQISNAIKNNQFAFYLQNNLVTSQLVNQQLQNFYASRLHELHLLYNLQQKQQLATSYFNAQRNFRGLPVYRQPTALLQDKNATLPPDVSACRSLLSFYRHNL